jgi:hypothetical protein
MSVNLSEHGLMAGIHSIKIQGCVMIENESENDSYMIDSEKVDFFYILPAEKINGKSKNIEIHNDDIRIENEKNEKEIIENRYAVNEIIDIDDIRYDNEKNSIEKSNENKSDDTNDNKINNSHIDNDNLNDNKDSDDDIDTLDINNNKPIILKKNETQISGMQPSAFRSQKFLKSDSNFLFNVPKGIYIKYPLPESVMYLHKKHDDDNETLNGQLPLEFHVAQK